MHLLSEGRLFRMGVCSISALLGIAYAVVYVFTESPLFEEMFFASFILRTIHAFLTGTFGTAVILYRRWGNAKHVDMIRERRPVLYWFAIIASVHLILPLVRAPSLLLTAGTGVFLLSTFVAFYLAGGWDAALGFTPETPTGAHAQAKNQPSVSPQRSNHLGGQPRT